MPFPGRKVVCKVKNCFFTYPYFVIVGSMTAYLDYFGILHFEEAHDWVCSASLSKLLVRVVVSVPCG